MDNLIHKIFKFVVPTDKQFIKSIIVSNETLEDKIKQISAIIAKQLNLTANENRQDFIVSKLEPKLQLTPDSVVADIGGGNGNVLSALAKSIGDNKNNKRNFICVEPPSSWVETYPFNHENVTYLYSTTPIDDASCDVVLAMVSLHHMSDDIIAATLAEIGRIVKPGGQFLVKEHDCDSAATHNLIDWEHHLYHIMDCAYNGQLVDVDRYMQQSVHNFQSKETWQYTIEKQGFELKERCNRFLDGAYSYDAKNSTKLYWDVYIKL